VTRQQIELTNEKLHNLYSSQNIFALIKSRMMGSEEHVLCMGKQEMSKNFRL
jgi:hypothetical protein